MSFKLARAKSQSIPRTLEKALAVSQVFLEGALLLVDGNGNYAECGTNPTSVAAIALSGAGPDTSIGNHLGRTEFPAGYMQGMAVQDEVQFRAAYLGTLPTVNGGSFGVTRDTDNRWKVDFTKSGSNLVVKLQRMLTAEMPTNTDAEVIVNFLPAVLQII